MKTILILITSFLSMVSLGVHTMTANEETRRSNDSLCIVKGEMATVRISRTVEKTSRKEIFENDPKSTQFLRKHLKNGYKNTKKTDFKTMKVPRKTPCDSLPCVPVTIIQKETVEVYHPPLIHEGHKKDTANQKTNYKK